MKNLSKNRSRLILCSFIVCLLLASITMGLSLKPTKAFAATNGDLNFDLIENGDAYEVSLADWTLDMVAIPYEYESKPVKKIADFGFYGSELEMVIIPESIEKIGDYAFNNSPNLETVLISNIDIVKQNIGEGAFAMCDKLQDMIIPKNVETMSDDVFMGVTQETRLHVRAASKPVAWSETWAGDATVIYGSTYSPELKFVAYQNGWSVSERQGFADKNLEIKIPLFHQGKRVLQIDVKAFNGNTFKSVKVIDNGEEEGFSGQERHRINVRNNAFINVKTENNAGFIDLGEYVTFNDDANGASKNVFSMAGVRSITIPSNTRVIGANMFNGARISTIKTPTTDANVLPRGLTTIETRAFAHSNGYPLISKISIPSTLTTLGDNAFASWKADQTVRFEAYEIDEKWPEQCGDAKIEVAGIKVTFDGYHEEKVYNKSELTTFPIAEKDYNYFGGWLNESNEQITDNAGLITADISKYIILKLTPEFIPYSYKIVYNGNGVSGSKDDSKHDYDKDVTFDAIGFSKKGYHISKWTTSADGSGEAYLPDTTYTSLSKVDQAIITLYAQWEANTYQIIYNANGGSGYMSSSYQVYDAPLKLSTNAFTKYAYGFEGWSETPDGDVLTWITNPGSQIVHNFVESGSVTLYAKWSLFQYSIKVVGSCPSCTYAPFPDVFKSMTVDSSYTHTAKEVCGQETGPLTACNRKFTHWEIRSDRGQGWDDSNITITIKNFANTHGEHFTITAKYQEGECVAEGTLITLANGTQKAVELLDGTEMLLVWNLLTGKFDMAPILFIDSDPSREYEVINLYFSDGTNVKVIDEHAFWDFDLNKYVYLREDAAQYIGHWFNKQITDENGNLSWTRVQLTNVNIALEITTAWSPVTSGYLCYYVNRMLSMPGAIGGFINIFEVNGESMKYDEAAYLADIEQYGLFTYEEFSAVLPLPQEIFDAFGGQYLKVSMGKGLITWDQIAQLIETYSKFFN